MTAYRIEVPLTTRNKLDGIIYVLKNKYKIDPIVENFVVPSANENVNTVNSLVYWNVSGFQIPGSSTNLPWVQLSFPNRYIFPTAYSMGSPYKSGAIFSFAKVWDVYGIYENDESNEVNWKLLKTDDTSESTYCVYLSGDMCNDNRTGTFVLRQNYLRKGFKHLRWRLKVQSPSSNYYFSTSGLDVYGTLSSSNTLSRFVNMNTCYCRFSRSRIFVSVIFCVA